MIKLITGKKGSGKTKILIDMINEAATNTNGCVICIEKGNALTYDINHSVRLCDTEHYDIDGYSAFYGFVAGLLAGNYDIKEVFVDSILKVGGRDYDALGKLLASINKIAQDVTVVFTVSADVSELPESVLQYLN